MRAWQAWASVTVFDGAIAAALQAVVMVFDGHAALLAHGARLLAAGLVVVAHQRPAQLGLEDARHHQHRREDAFALLL
jgi:hypothetical protein